MKLDRDKMVTVLQSYPLAVVRGTDGREYVAIGMHDGWVPVAMCLEDGEEPSIEPRICPQIARSEDECPATVQYLLAQLRDIDREHTAPKGRR